MFGKHTDYHGSRTYNVEKPRFAMPSQLALKWSFLIAWTKIQIERFLRSGAEASDSIWIMRGNEKHFTMLGGKQLRRSAGRPIIENFPARGPDSHP